LAARARLTGAEVERRLALVLDFSGGRVSRLETYLDIDQALEAAGLS